MDSKSFKLNDMAHRAVKGMCTLLCIILTLTMAVSCNSSKGTTSSSKKSSYTSLDDRYKTVVDSYQDWSTYVSSGKINIASTSATIQVRMQKGKFISISLRPLFGIEVGRMYLSNDSIIILDKYHKKYVAEGIQAFTSGVPFSISDLQDVFLSRGFILNQGTLSLADKSNVDLADSGDNWTIAPRQSVQGYKYKFVMDAANRLQALILNDATGTTQPYSVTYSDYTSVGNSNAKAVMARNVQIGLQIGSKPFSFIIQLNPDNAKWNATIDDPRPVNDDYTHLTFAQYLSSLK